MGPEPAEWARGWRSLIFPGLFLIYLGQTAHGIGVHASGGQALLGYVVLIAFCVVLPGGVPARVGRPPAAVHRSLFVAMLALFVVEVPFAHEDAFVMCVFIAVLTDGDARAAHGDVVVAMALGRDVRAGAGPVVGRGRRRRHGRRRS